ncbi:MAG: hypothetical protein AB7I59_06125 [Geminicoccaceae bacterium]
MPEVSAVDLPTDPPRARPGRTAWLPWWLPLWVPVVAIVGLLVIGASMMLMITLPL